MSSLTRAQQKPPLGLQLIQGHPINRGLVGRWLFNERTGKYVYDLSNNNHTGTFSGNIGFNPDGIDINLNGRISFGNIAALKPPVITIFAIIYLEAAPVSWGHIYGSDYLEGAWFSISSARRLSFYCNGSTWNPTTTQLSIGTWYQIAACYDGSTRSLYINGVNQGSNTAVSGDLNWTGAFDIRTGENDATERDIDCIIKTMCVYKRALTPNEIQQLYVNPYLGVDTGEMPIELIAGAMGGEEPPDPTGGQIIRMNIF